MGQEDGIRGGYGVECLMDCFGGVVNLEPLESFSGDKSGSEMGGASRLLSEFKKNEKKVCPRCLTEIRAGHEETCFFCKEKIQE